MTRALALLLALAAAAPSSAEEAADPQWLALSYFYSDPLEPFFARTVSTGPYETQRRGGRSARFEMPKPPREFRVFVVGGSIGALHHDHPRGLRQLLKAALPSRDVVVIGAAMPGYDSLREERVFREVLEYSPNLIVLMSGHNETYERPLVPALRLRLILSTIGATHGGGEPPELTVEQRRIDAMKMGVTFEERVSGMLRAAKARGVPVVVVVPPINYGESVMMGEMPRLEDFARGWVAYLRGEYKDALRAWEGRLAPGADDAVLEQTFTYSLAAKALTRLGRHREARAMERRVVGVRPFFHGMCRPACQALLARVASREGAATADVDAAFRRASGRHLPDFEQFDDTLHWNSGAHSLVMSTVLEAARKHPGLAALPWNPEALRAYLARTPDLSAAAEERPPLVDGALHEITKEERSRPFPPSVLRLARAHDRFGEEGLRRHIAGYGRSWRGQAWGMPFTPIDPVRLDWNLGLAEHLVGHHEAAALRLRAAASAPSPNFRLLTDLAVAESLNGRADAALEALQRAREASQTVHEVAEVDVWALVLSSASLLSPAASQPVKLTSTPP